MNHRRSTAVALVLSCAALGTAPVWAQDASATAPATKAAPAVKQDAKAAKLVTDLQKHLSAVKTLQLRIAQKMTVEMGPMKQDMDAAADFALERPNKLAMLHREGMQGSTLVSDGTTLSFHMPMMNAYTQQKAPVKIDALFDPVSTMEMGVFDTGIMPFLGMFVNPKDAKSIGEGITAGRIGTEYVGAEEIDGKPVDRVRLTLGGDALAGMAGPMMPMGADLKTKLDLWIGKDAAGRPELRRMSPDLDEIMKAMGEMQGDDNPMFDMGDMKMSMVVDLKDWKVDAPVDAKMFAFTAPAGANKVDDMMAAINEMAGGMMDEEMDDAGGAVEGPEAKLLGNAAPEFALEELGGGTITNASLQGKIVVLDFWATWCGPCIRAMPILEKVTKAYADKGVVFYAINLQESAEQVRGFLTKRGFDIKVLMDTDGKVANKYFVGGIPQTVIIGKDGSVQAVHVGLSPDLERKLTDELETLISKGSLGH